MTPGFPVLFTDAIIIALLVCVLVRVEALLRGKK